MRALTIVLAFGALGAGFIMLDRATVPPDGQRRGPSTAEALGVAEALASRIGLSVGGIVLGPALAPDAAGGERDFRGLQSAEGRLRPVYGRVRTVCTGRAVGPACWEISYLEIDGRPVAHKVAALDTRTAPPADDDEAIETADTRLAAATAPAPTEVRSPPPAPTALGAVEPPPGGMPRPAGGDGAHDPDPAAPDPAAMPGAAGGPVPDIPAPERIATGEVPVPASRPGLAAAATGGADADARTDRDRTPTHAVDRPVINVRDGPGTDTSVVARLPEGMRLSLIGRHQDWGRFVVLDGAASGREVWAALRILKPLP